LSKREDPQAADAEEDDDDQRRAEDRPRRRECGDGQREHCDRVHHAEGDDRDGDRVEPEPDAAESAQGADLDDVVEPERQDDSAGRGRTAGRETARAIGALAAWEQPVPSERAEAEAGEIGDSSEEDQGQMRALQGPTRFAQTPGYENARPQRENAERDATRDSRPPIQTAEGAGRR
jgi:hypothetical protein